MNRKFKTDTLKLTKMGMLVAISIVLVCVIHFPIFPSIPFLEYDPADVPIIIGTFAFGPIEGGIITLITALIQGTTVSASSGPYGIIMHLVSTWAYVMAAGAIYSREKTKKSAVIAMCVGTVTMVVIMIFANMVMTPLFTGMPVDAIIRMMPIIIAFNFIKAGGNSIITFFVYKKISKYLHNEETA